MSAKTWAQEHCCCNKAMKQSRAGARKLRKYRKAETRATRRTAPTEFQKG